MTSKLQKIVSISSISKESDIDVCDEYGLDIVSNGEEEPEFTNFDICHPRSSSYSDELYSFLEEVDIQLENPKSLQLIHDCTGGTYKCIDYDYHPLGIFKPSDEEPCTVNNPKGYNKVSKWGLIDGIPSGEAYVREYIAYSLHSNIIPTTVIINVNNNSKNSNNVYLKKKCGSFQKYVNFKETAEDFGPVHFSTSDIHRIGLLDLHILNMDRHENNLLCKLDSDESDSLSSYSFRSVSFPNLIKLEKYQEEKEEEDKEEGHTTGLGYRSRSFSHIDEICNHLIPIDHGYSIPNIVYITSEPSWCWYKWPQSKLPFSQQTISEVMNINIDEDIKNLKKDLGDLLTNEIILTLKITTLWIKMGVNFGLNLYQLASIYQLNGGRKTTAFNEMVNEIKTECGDLYENIDITMEYFEQLFNNYLQNI